MSRGFVREGDQEEIPMVMPRAYLPAGVTNYVTPEGLAMLEKEREDIQKEIDALYADEEHDHHVDKNFLGATLRQLETRIKSATLVDVANQPKDKVCFGATVTIQKIADGELAEYRIVGVDEADISAGKISFISPISRAMVNKKIGDEVVFRSPKGTISFKIIKITY
ncbi:MAG: GreA/GreB family elongation factor [Bacteroidales bacterium]|nr:GreA/GreB family elongation factor [Bacteroidales bacterium]